ncbi:MAG: endonuclease III [Gammaproteobacteria bacterium CG_4_10_14_0_8_um_filter_38_16]|nr:MAG: endonuclease III [Gammaproteobacteria bacterium CG_4_10_14_0_8_um_filter_38_16]PJA03674.1 MAG: endonuclease III [Gammaproteobacteria bacterium CG_4_10_14_0_2_um_filter_38_22]PJB11340.1 MAG: endonuclease III [Gammaproteobacteria bacterium CG_4_9_14_3_um_filter_38_9]
MKKNEVEKIFAAFQQSNTTPTTELIFNSHFELLIAVILSAQATDISVNKATKNLFLIANTPEKIISIGIDELKKHIKTINLYPTKAKHIIKTCEILISQFHSTVPNNRDDLESLPGVGRKTANVILNTAFDEPTIAVDTHIFRVSNRIGLSNGKTPRTVEDDLLKTIPKKYLKEAHHWLVLHGRYICTARNPKCAECPIFKWCEYKAKTIIT